MLDLNSLTLTHCNKHNILLGKYKQTVDIVLNLPYLKHIIVKSN